MQPRIKLRICIAATVVILGDLFNLRYAAIVHVRSRSHDFTQSRSFESAPIALPFANSKSSIIRKPTIAPCDARVVKLLISKVQADMPSHTVRFAAKQLQASARFRRQRFLISILKFVEW